MKSMLKDAFILFAITLVAGLLLGYVNEVTKGPIAQAKENAKQAAYQQVFSDADTFTPMDVDSQYDNDAASLDEVLGAYKGSELLGYVVTVTEHEGYGGDIQFSMGVTLDGTLNAVSILSISETAGLGMQAESVLVPQFANKSVANEFEYTKSGAVEDNQIDAISGATITTKAFVKGVNFGIDYLKNTNLIGEAK